MVEERNDSLPLDRVVLQLLKKNIVDALRAEPGTKCFTHEE